MYAIAPPLTPNDSGDQVANLQAALLFLLKQDAFKSFDPPRNPRANELKALTEGLRTEQASQSFGPATQQLLVYLQLQEGLGAFFDGRVEETTAQRLNEWLVQLGVFYRVQCRVGEVLVVQFNLQFALGDEGIVDEKKADALNALLKKFGAFGAGTGFVGAWHGQRRTQPPACRPRRHRLRPRSAPLAGTGARRDRPRGQVRDPVSIRVLSRSGGRSPGPLTVGPRPRNSALWRCNAAGFVSSSRTASAKDPRWWSIIRRLSCSKQAARAVVAG